MSTQKEEKTHFPLLPTNLSTDCLRRLSMAVMGQFDRLLLESSNHFVSLLGGMQRVTEDKDRFDLMDNICKTFVGRYDYSNLLLLGGAGTGKTWFGQKLICELWKEHQAGKPIPIPLWISLPNFTHPHRDLLKDFLSDLRKAQIGTNIREANRLTKKDMDAFLVAKPPLFIVLDGYDELTPELRLHNFYEENRWNTQGWYIQVITTSRQEALPENYAAYFKKGSFRALEYHAQLYNEAQLSLAVEAHLRAKQKASKEPEILEKVKIPTLSKERYLDILHRTPELREFIGKPFLIKVVLEVLPEIIDEMEKNEEKEPANAASAGLKSKRFARHALYQRFMAQHYERETQRLKRARHLAAVEAAYQNKTFAEIVEDFTKNLARVLFERHLTVINWNPANNNPSQKTGWAMASVLEVKATSAELLNQNPEWLVPFFDDRNNPQLEKIRAAAPLIKTGYSYAFLHKSILEFYAADHLFSGSLLDGWHLAGRNLNVDLRDEKEVLLTLSERVHQEAIFQETLWAIIEQSKYEPSVWRAAANAMTILNYARVSFSQRDLRRIRIGGLENEQDSQSGWGADLSYAVLSETNLSEADLRYVNFTQAHLVNTVLNGACLDGINFGEHPCIEGVEAIFAKDGLSLVTRSRTTLKIFAWPSRKLMKNFEVNDPISGFAFHPTGQQIAIVHQRTRKITHSEYDYDGSIKRRDEVVFERYKISLWDTNTQSCIRDLFGYSEEIRVGDITYNPGGDRLAVSITRYSPPPKGGYSFYSLRNQLDTMVQQWDAKTGKQLGIVGGLPSVNCLIYSPDGSRLATNTSNMWNPVTKRPLEACMRHAIQQWDAITGSSLACMRHAQYINSFMYHPKENRLVSGSADNIVREWDVITGELLQTYEGHQREISCVAYHPDDARLVSASADRTVQEWDTTTGVSLRIYGWNTSRITYSPDGRYLIFYDNDIVLNNKSIRQYDIATGISLRRSDNHGSAIQSIAYCGFDDTRIASLDEDQCSIREWSTITGNLLNKHKLDNKAYAVTYSNKNGRLAAVSSETIWQWNVITGDRFQPYQLKNIYPVVCYSPDDTRLISKEFRNQVVQLDANTGAVLCLHKASDKNSSGIAYGLGGKRLITTESGDTTVLYAGKKTFQEWDAVSGKKLCTYQYRAHTNNVDEITYSYDGHRLASRHDFGELVREWSTATGVLLRTFKTERGWFEFIKNDDRIKHIAYSPNNRYLALNNEHVIHIVSMDISTDNVNLSKETFKLRAHFGSVKTFAWSPDGTKIATGGSDQAVRLWCVCDATGQVNPMLLWQTHSFLTSRGLNLHQVTGLTDQNYQLLMERSSGTPLKGKLANPILLSSKTVLAERNSQIHIPKGILPIIQIGSTSDSYVITSNDWLISIIRNKEIRLRGASDFVGRSGGHVWLLLMGLDENHFTVFKEIHFFLDTLDTDAPTSGLLFKSGKGLISVRHCVPYDLFADLTARKYEAKSWMISRAQAETLCENVEKDRTANLQYINTGHSPALFSAPTDFNCLTFCEKHLKEIDCTVLEDREKSWYDFILAVPTRYLPTPLALQNPEPTTSSQGCSLM